MNVANRARSLSCLIVVLVLASSALSAGPVSVRDARGKVIVIKSPPQRIVSLAPSNTELLFALGLEKRIVGVTTWCEYPTAAKKKPKIGDRTINVEKVVSLKPDLILAHATLNDSYIQRFETLGKTVIAIDPKTYSEVISDILMLGRATGTSARASAVVKEMRSALAKAKKHKAVGLRPNVLVVIQPSPLWAAGPQTLVDEMLEYAGGHNLAHDSKPGFNQFPVEMAIARRPDVLIVGRGEKKFFTTSPIWKGTEAVKSNHIYEMDFDLLVRPGPRLAQGLARLASLLQ